MRGPGTGLALGALAAALPALAHAALPWPGGPAATSRAAQGVAALTPRAAPRFHGVREIDGKAGPVGLVAFSFDDGPHRDTTPRVLAALAAHQVPATFFVNGYRFDEDKPADRRNRDALREVIAAGHLVGNHTFDHARLEKAGRRAAFSQIWRAQQLLAPLVGDAPRLFRPPYGKLSTEATALLADLGFTVVRWSVDVGDFQMDDAAAIRERVVDAIFASGGGVVLLHDAHLPTILPVLLDYFAATPDGTPLPPPALAAAWRTRTTAHLAEICGVDIPRVGD
jgi:peptidoglycan/xylan/chitin deacetylase (PgdA/CDA1 family)